MTEPLFKRAVIIGLGLIGGSLARAMHSRHIAEQVVGVCHHPKTGEKALELGIIDLLIPIEEACEDADIVILCTPVETFESILTTIAPTLRPDTIVTDVGSVKKPVVDEMEATLQHFTHVIPAHPIAGTEKSGVESGFDTLFDGKKVILTPLPNTEQEAIEKTAKMWEICGSEIHQMAPGQHDQLFGYLSHGIHMLVFCYIHMIQDSLEKYPSFDPTLIKQTMRVAESSPTLWSNLFCLNRKPLRSSVEHYLTSLDEISALIQDEKSEALTAIIQECQGKQLSIDGHPIQLSEAPHLLDTWFPALLGLAALHAIAEMNLSFAGSSFIDFTSSIKVLDSLRLRHLFAAKAEIQEKLNEFRHNIDTLMEAIDEGDMIRVLSHIKDSQHVFGELGRPVDR